MCNEQAFTANFGDCARVSTFYSLCVSKISQQCRNRAHTRRHISFNYQKNVIHWKCLQTLAVHEIVLWRYNIFQRGKKAWTPEDALEALLHSTKNYSQTAIPGVQIQTSEFHRFISYGKYMRLLDLHVLLSVPLNKYSTLIKFGFSWNIYATSLNTSLSRRFIKRKKSVEVLHFCCNTFRARFGCSYRFQVTAEPNATSKLIQHNGL